MNGEIIKSFLVGLGFGVDESSLAKFNKAIEKATVKVTALYGSIQVMSAAVFYGISKIAEGFEQIGYEYRIISPMINKTLMMRQALLSAYKAAGIDITKVVKQSVLFNFSLAKTKFALEAIYKSVGTRFLPLLTKQMDVFRGKIYANMPKILEALTKFVNFLFKAFEATTILGARVFSILGRVWDFFKQLDTATNGWSTKILAAVAAWELLNLSFIATPLGMLITGMVALLALFDDFKTWQEGGESLFDWSRLEESIMAVGKAFGSMLDIVMAIGHYISVLIDLISKLFHLDFRGFLGGLGDLANAVGNVIGKAADHFGNIVGVLDSAGRAFGIGNSSPEMQNGTPNGQPSPLLPQNSTSNQRVSQETNINVMGSADANSTAKSVANEQNRVNFDMTRNMKGATR